MAAKGKYLRTISGNDVSAIEHYKELERINEVMMIEQPSKYEIDIFLTKSAKDKTHV